MNKAMNKALIQLTVLFAMGLLMYGISVFAILRVQLNKGLRIACIIVGVFGGALLPQGLFGLLAVAGVNLFDTQGNTTTVAFMILMVLLWAAAAKKRNARPEDVKS